LILFAQACGQAVQIDLGQKTGERWLEAEAYRLKAELLYQMGQTLPDE
jgi:hypothetical protein